MGNPDYANARLMSSEEIKNMTRDELINSYTIIKTEFEFPEKTKYPSIPCNADEITIVYPLRGRAVLTGLEYLVAVNQGCNIKIEEAFQIPFEKEYELDEFGQRTEVFKYINHPFKTCVKELQDERRRQPKRTFLNYFYKLLVNAIYGLIVQGINNKKKFDIKTGGTVRMEGSELSNPILAS